MNGLFFELLQVAIGNRQALTSRPTDEEWEFLYSECEKHALLGITFCGVERLPKEQFPPFDVAAEWVHDAQVAKDRNMLLNKRCKEVCEYFENDGFDSCILKGQSNLANYPEYLKDYRTAGDIDVLCWPKNGNLDNVKVLAYVKGLYATALKDLKSEIMYHHVDWEFAGIPVEIHFRASFFFNPLYNRKFQKWVNDSLHSFVCLKEKEFPIPSVSFNAVYQLVHIYRHLFSEGIGLRQLLDYYFVLQTLSVPLHRGKCREVRDKRLEVRRPPQSPCVGGEVSVEGLEVSGERIGSLSTGEGGGRGRVMNIIERLGMKKFAGAVMYVLQTVFSMPDTYLLCPPDKKEGEFLLSEIMISGNFGRSDNRVEAVRKVKDTKDHFSTFIAREKFVFRLLRHYPSEAIWAPFWSVFIFFHIRWQKWRW